LLEKACRRPVEAEQTAKVCHPLHAQDLRPARDWVTQGSVRGLLRCVHGVVTAVLDIFVGLSIDDGVVDAALRAEIVKLQAGCQYLLGVESRLALGAARSWQPD